MAVFGFIVMLPERKAVSDSIFQSQPSNTRTPKSSSTTLPNRAIVRYTLYGSKLIAFSREQLLARSS